MSRVYLRAMRAGFRAALESGLKERHETLAVNGTTVRLRFAGADMAEATLPALAPLIGDPPRGSATFTVELWDSASTDIGPPMPPWGPDAGGPLGAVKGHNDETLRTVVDHAARTITVCDLECRQAVVWAERAAALPGWWRAMPLRVLLGWLLARPGHHVVHAGAVGVDGRGLLVAGAGGAGKSTLAVSCLEAGMDYVGDDYVLLSGGPNPRAYALYGTAKLDEFSLAAVPALADRARQQDLVIDDDKLVLDLQRLRPSRLAPSTTVEAVLVPQLVSQQAGAISAINPIPKSTALRALAPSTIFQAPDDGASALQVLSDVVRSVSCYELQLGADAERAPDLLRSLLAREIAPAPASAQRSS
jgi:hypothetical protein